eukprot:s296_g6.t1
MARVRPRCFQRVDHVSSSATKLCSDARFMTASHAKSSSVLSSVRDMFIYDAASIRVALAVLLFLEPLQGFDPFLQFLHHAPQNHGELLIIESHELPSVQILRLAHRRAQLPAGLHVLGYEADLLLATIDALLKLRLHGVDGLLFHSVFLSYRICLPGRVESGVDESFACLPTSGLEVNYIHDKQRKKDQAKVKIAQRSMREMKIAPCVECSGMFEDRIKWQSTT